MPRKNSNAHTTTRRRKATHQPTPPVDIETANTGAEDRVWQALQANPGTTAAEIAVAAGVGRSTATKTLARLATEGSAVRKPGSKPRAADRWQVADEPAAEPNPSSPHVATTEPATTRKSEVDTGSRVPQSKASKATTTSKPSRLRPGELHGMVEDFLTERPDMEFTPGDIGRKLNRSSGAVANALVKIAEKGAATLVSDRPKKYQAAQAAGD